MDLESRVEAALEARKEAAQADRRKRWADGLIRSAGRKQMKTLADVRGRVAKEELDVEGRFYVYWGNPSLDEGHRVATLHRVLDNGTAACHYVAGGAELVNLPDDLSPTIRWYRACKSCKATY